jgi:histone H3/H4
VKLPDGQKRAAETATTQRALLTFLKLRIESYLNSLGVIMKDRKFSLYDVEQFLREAGAEKVTEDAVLNLERELEKLADKVTDKAMRYAEHAGRRKLIRKEDILLTGMNGSSHGSHHYSRPANFRRKARITHAVSNAHR